MNAKHTPGPWEWDGNVWSYDSDNEAPWLVQSGSDHRVFVLMGSIRCNEEADARLIAAEPELLEALQEAISLIESIDGRDNSCDPKSDLSDLKAAIAKATGA
ncbi:hypothetical protein [Ralstonia syzygii]|uniref:hypothetical protein n=1 Tax=Ralstonia syzygii TaxID=28097 RepID=UPI00351440A0